MRRAGIAAITIGLSVLPVVAGCRGFEQGRNDQAVAQGQLLDPASTDAQRVSAQDIIDTEPLTSIAKSLEAAVAVDIGAAAMLGLAYARFRRSLADWEQVAR